MSHSKYFGNRGSFTFASVAPSSPVSGDLWYDTAENKSKIYIVNTWIDISEHHWVDASRHLWFRADTDIVNSTNTFADVTGFLMPVLSGLIIQFSVNIIYTSATNGTSLELSCNGPATSALDYSVLIATSQSAFRNSCQTAYDTVENPGGGHTGRAIARVEGSAVFSAAGMFAIRFRSDNNGSAVTIRRGSICRIFF